MKTSVLLDHEPVADGGFLVRALLRVEGDPPARSDRIPLNLSLVLDRSGSMSGGKLAAAREAAADLVKRLWPDDTVSVVSFDDSVDVVAPPSTGTDDVDVSDLISNIEPGGMTNLSGGWLRGRELLADTLREGGVNRVVLLTDGHANVGITDHHRLVGLCQDGGGKGISTTTIGFGDGYDEDLLRGMADAGGGGAYYIEEVDQAVGVFEEELEGLASLVAQNLRVSITPGAGADFVQVFHEYPSHAEGETLTLEVGDLYGREPRRILIEFMVPPIDEDEGASGDHGVADPIEVAHLAVVGHVLTAAGGVEAHTISLPITLTPEEGGKVEPEIRKEILLVEAARSRTRAIEYREAGDYEQATQVLEEALDRLSDSGLTDEAMVREMQDLETFGASFDERSVSMADIKYMKQRVYSTMRSRGRAHRRIERDR